MLMFRAIVSEVVIDITSWWKVLIEEEALEMAPGMQMAPGGKSINLCSSNS